MTTDKGCVRTLPHRHDGMDAFFAARFVKNESIGFQSYNPEKII